MSTNINLPAGAFLTSIDGRRCTAVPRAGRGAGGEGGNQQRTTTQPEQQTTTQELEQQTTTQELEQQTTTQELEQQTTIQEPQQQTAEQTTAVATPEASTEVQGEEAVAETSTSTASTSTSIPSSIAGPGPSQEVQEPPEITSSQPASPPSISTDSTSVGQTTSPVVLAPAVPTISSPIFTFSRIPISNNAGESITEEGSEVESSNVQAIFSSVTSDDSGDQSSQTNPAQSSSASVTSEATAVTSLAEIPNLVNLQSEVETGNALSTTSTAVAPSEASATVGQPTTTAVTDTSNTQKTVAIVGGVVGGTVILGLFAFLLWFWRRKLNKKRRSALLTPLSTEASFPRDEKNYIIDSRSVGPTPKSEKLRAELLYGFSRVRDRLSAFLGRREEAPSVNLDRGNSQFMDPLPSRSSSRGSSRTGLRGGKLTTKDRLVDWWDRLTEDVSFNWKIRNEQVHIGSNLDPFTAAAAKSVKKNAALAGNNQPDFLTLLSMDDQQLNREASLRQRDSWHGQGQGSGEHFLGGLGLNLDGKDPFADYKAPPNHANLPASVTSQPKIPIVDTVPPSLPMPTFSKQTTYVAEVRRSRGSVSSAGHTAGGMDMGISSTAAQRQSHTDSYRESLQSVESFATRRNKFRSDPFDLEQPELLANRIATPNSAVDGRYTSGNGVSHPSYAHTRNDSFTSRYLGLNLSDFSEPGPDVGPAAIR